MTNHKSPSAVAADGLELRLIDAVEEIGKSLPTRSLLEKRMRLYDLQRRLTIAQHPLVQFSLDAIRTGAPLETMLRIPLAFDLWIRSCYQWNPAPLVDVVLHETEKQSEADPWQLRAVFTPCDVTLRHAMQKTIADIHAGQDLVRHLDHVYHNPRQLVVSR